MKILGILFGCFTALAPGPVFASDFPYFLHGNQLYMECQDAGNNFERAKCIAYIIGVADTSEDVMWGLERKDFCFPKQLAASQLRDVVMLWLQKNPQERSLNASGLVYNAFKEAFPCK